MRSQQLPQALAKAIAAAVVVVALCVLANVVPVGLGAWAHTRRLREYSGAWQHLAHPPGTVRVSINSAVGLISGNGNHCDYFVGEMRQFQGDRAAIEAYYDRTTVSDRSVHVAFPDGNRFEDIHRWSMPGGLTTPQAWMGSENIDLGKVYLVYMIDVGNDPGFDIRCH